jgi:hypothetical protein
MHTLTIDLQDGFKDDTIFIKVPNIEPFEKEHVNTSLLTGFAGSFKSKTGKEYVDIEVKIPTKGLEKVISLEISADTYIGISIVNRSIEEIVSSTPFGYG